LFVCVVAALRKNLRTDLHEIFRNGWQWANEQMIKFRWPSLTDLLDGRTDIATLVRRALAAVRTVSLSVLLILRNVTTVVDLQRRSTALFSSSQYSASDAAAAADTDVISRRRFACHLTHGFAVTDDSSLHSYAAVYYSTCVVRPCAPSRGDRSTDTTTPWVAADSTSLTDAGKQPRHRKMLSTEMNTSAKQFREP